MESLPRRMRAGRWRQHTEYIQGGRWALTQLSRGVWGQRLLRRLLMVVVWIASRAQARRVVLDVCVIGVKTALIAVVVIEARNVVT
jgi:hypothetical protein